MACNTGDFYSICLKWFKVKDCKELKWSPGTQDFSGDSFQNTPEVHFPLGIAHERIRSHDCMFLQGSQASSHWGIIWFPSPQKGRFCSLHKFKPSQAKVQYFPSSRSSHPSRTGCYWVLLVWPSPTSQTFSLGSPHSLWGVVARLKQFPKPAVKLQILINIFLVIFCPFPFTQLLVLNSLCSLVPPLPKSQV